MTLFLVYLGSGTENTLSDGGIPTIQLVQFSVWFQVRRTRVKLGPGGGQASRGDVRPSDWGGGGCHRIRRLLSPQQNEWLNKEGQRVGSGQGGLPGVRLFHFHGVTPSWSTSAET